jgi:TRAP-type C4-dicarboxylate transport system substrate-binding protein
MHGHWIAAAAGLALLGAVAGAPAEAQIVLKGGHISPKDSVEGITIDRFADLVKQKTNGQIAMQIFPSEQLGKSVSQIDSTAIGNQDLVFAGSPEMERFSPGLRLLGLNWVVPNVESFRKVTKSPIWNEIVHEPLGKAGFVVLASNWERGPYRVMVSTKPVRSLDDLKGMKLRIAPIDSWRRQWTALGMQVVVLAWNDVYLGLSQGTVEAVTAPLALVGPMKFTEVAKHITRTDEFWQILMPLVNRDLFNRLTPAQQQAMRDAAAEVGDWFVAEQERVGAADIERLKKEHGATYSVIDVRPGVERMKPVIKQMEAENFIPAGLYDKVLALK